MVKRLGATSLRSLIAAGDEMLLIRRLPRVFVFEAEQSKSTRSAYFTALAGQQRPTSSSLGAAPSAWTAPSFPVVQCSEVGDSLSVVQRSRILGNLGFKTNWCPSQHAAVSNFRESGWESAPFRRAWYEQCGVATAAVDREHLGQSWRGFYRDFARVSQGFPVADGGFLAHGGTAGFCSEARASTAAADAVHQSGKGRGVGAKNLTRWSQRVGQEKSQSMVMYLVAMVVAVVGFTYASVPLYRRFCAATGYGGTVQRRETVEDKIAKHGTEDAAAARELVVHFNADVADSMPWKFTPCQNQVKVKVGQSSLAFYTAENTSSEDITGVSTYNVAPMQAGSYFNKIQCFCFEEQRIRAGEKIDMPVLFYIDPEFANDPKMNNINSLILSYTFFKVDDDEEDE